MTDRASWLALALFVIGNWTEEEYFSPQAAAYLMALVLLALAVRTPQDQSDTRRARLAQLGAWVVIAIAVVASHQLTPFAVTAWLFALLVARRARWPALTPLMPVFAFAWLAFAARDFWSGHRSVLFGGVGSVGSTVNSSLGSRLSGSAAHHAIVELRIAITLVMLVLAAVGIVLRWRERRDWLLPVGVVIPFGLVALQSYGGEILIRADLFALPFLAMAGSQALDALCSVRPRWAKLAGPAVAMGIVLAMTGALVVARGGNDPYVAMTPADVRIATVATHRLAPGSAITFLTGYAPLRASRVGTIGEVSLQASCTDPTVVARCVLHLAPQALFVSGGQEAYGEIVEGWPKDWLPSTVSSLVASGQYRVWLALGDAEVLKRTRDAMRTGQGGP